MGDLNATPESDEIKIIYGSPLTDNFNQTNQRSGPVGTFNGFDMTVTPARRIDYVFVSQEFNVEKYQAVNSIIDGRYLSDHFPIVVQLKMN